MSTSQTVLFGAFLLALGGLLFRPSPHALALANGPYQLMHHSNPTANAGVFRLDTASGEVSYCYLTQNSALVCSAAVK